MVSSNSQKKPLADILQIGYSEKLRKFYKKAPVIDIFFQWGCSLIYPSQWYFIVNIAKFLVHLKTMLII